MLPDDFGRIGSVGRHDAGSTARGFTLLEVVVALAIAGLALVGLFRAGSGGVLAVDAAGRVNQARERAQSHLAALGRITTITPGETDGGDGGGHRGRVRPLPRAVRHGGARAWC